MTTTDQAALLAAIRANPDDDTLRLAYADWLDEQPVVRVKCARCDGDGTLVCFRGPGATNPYHTNCPACDDGTILDTSNADRAELIRGQCEAAAWKRDGHGEECTVVQNFYKSPESKKPGGQMRLQCYKCTDLQYTEFTASQIISRHHEWSQVNCLDCDGHGITDHVCGTCRGTGDLLKRIVQMSEPTSFMASEPRHLHWSRGFIECVEARSEEVWYDDQSGEDAGGGNSIRETLPTPWARALVAANHEPMMVREIRLTDWPTPFLDVGWCVPMMDNQRKTLPEDVWQSLYSGRVPKIYPTREAAVSALGRAVYEWVQKS